MCWPLISTSSQAPISTHPGFLLLVPYPGFKGPAPVYWLGLHDGKVSKTTTVKWGHWSMSFNASGRSHMNSSVAILVNCLQNTSSSCLTSPLCFILSASRHNPLSWNPDLSPQLFLLEEMEKTISRSKKITTRVGNANVVLTDSVRYLVLFVLSLLNIHSF